MLVGDLFDHVHVSTLIEGMGLTVAEAARQCCLSKATLGRVLNGERKPGIEIACRISAGLRISLSEIVPATRTGRWMAANWRDETEKNEFDREVFSNAREVISIYNNLTTPFLTKELAIEVKRKCLRGLPQCNEHLEHYVRRLPGNLSQWERSRFMLRVILPERCVRVVEHSDWIHEIRSRLYANSHSLDNGRIACAVIPNRKFDEIAKQIGRLLPCPDFQYVDIADRRDIAVQYRPYAFTLMNSFPGVAKKIFESIACIVKDALPEFPIWETHLPHQERIRVTAQTLKTLDRLAIQMAQSR